MQEQRAQELKNIEDQRAKLLRRQEKLKNNVLKDAQAYRQKKAERAKNVDEIQISNIKNEGRGAMSPVRLNSNGVGTGLTSP